MCWTFYLSVNLACLVHEIYVVFNFQFRFLVCWKDKSLQSHISYTELHLLGNSIILTPLSNKKLSVEGSISDQDNTLSFYFPYQLIWVPGQCRLWYDVNLLHWPIQSYRIFAIRIFFSSFRTHWMGKELPDTYKCWLASREIYSSCTRSERWFMFCFGSLMVKDPDIDRSFCFILFLVQLVQFIVDRTPLVNAQRPGAIIR